MESQTGIQIENLMIAANTNTVINSISFCRETKLIAYAAANTILILDPYHINQTVPKVLFSLKGHTERVNGVSWINERALVSISSDKSVIVWGYESGSDPRIPENWKRIHRFENAHDEFVNYLRTYSNGNEHYILTACAGGVMKLWQGTQIENIAYKEKLIFGKNLQESIGLCELGEKHLLLAIGGYDLKIHIYLIPRIPYQTEKTFKYKFSLLGHLNSLRDFDFTHVLEKGVRYMASCSQDSNIRIWKIQPLENISENYGGHLEEGDLKQYESKTSYVLQDDDESKVYNVTLESVLLSHQDSISSIKWGQKSEAKEIKELNDFCLLSSSFDFTVCVWKPDEQTGIWSVESTLGAMQGNKHAYYGAIFLQDDQSIMAYTYNGAIHQWKKSESGQWVPQLTVKGHFGEVSDLDWDQYETTLTTCSTDQTTRLFSKYGSDKGWFEFGRPQVHGYDMNTLAILRVKGTKSLPNKILSGGDEKVLRLFEAPFSYVKIFNQLHPQANDIQLSYSETKSNEEIEKMIGSEAKKQPLGLMNKPVILLANQNMRVDEEEGGGIGPDFDPNKILSNAADEAQIIEDLAEPPVEDVLMSKTLWPEQQKLYGHAYEIFCVATSYIGDCAASASKAKDKKYADIIIWDLRKGQTTVPCCKLSAHSLTVVQIEFSHNDLYLLSCSRDRSWALFKRDSLESLQFTLAKKVKDAHSRIIWGVSFSHDDYLFATASREKSHSLKVWHGPGLNTEDGLIGTMQSETVEENPSATAVRFFPEKIIGNSKYALAVGLESGDVLIWQQNEDKNWIKIYQIPEYYSHCSSVRRIKFNQRYSKNGEYVIATCGNDNTVRIAKLAIQ